MKTTISTTKLMILVIMSATIALSACKKDAAPPSKTDLLTTSQWKITAFTVDPAIPVFDTQGNITGFTTDMFPYMESCSKDDTFKFKSDNTVEFDEGALKCDTTAPQTTSGTWSFKTNETILSIIEDGSLQDYTLMELTESSLKMKYSQTDGSDTYTFIIAFSHL